MWSNAGGLRIVDIADAQGLARFKLPSRLEVRADLPRTASGKVQKAPLRAELSAVDA